ncbi:MAG: Crp/Fnr family transcriptional regulator [Desulfosarcina sp.]|nr:Crp/Fnr family transcriptional regulator [Desulfobacterales bacterium]
METIADILSRIPIFSGLSRARIEDVGQITIDRHYRKGEIIFSQGDKGDGFYIVARGTIKIFKLSTEGKEHIMRIVGPGEPFGQVAVYAGRAFPAGAQAISDSHLLFLPKAEFVRRITADPTLALNMLSGLSMRLREFTVHVERLALKEVPGRLAAYLIHLSEDPGNEGGLIVLNISKVQLSSLLGTTPETLSRILSRMADRGLIEVSGRDIRIRDDARLKTLAEHGKILPGLGARSLG